MNITKRNLHATLYLRDHVTNFVKTHLRLLGVRTANSKHLVYSQTEIGLETYLTYIKNIKHRCAMAKLRLSNHPLLIETGRHSKIERQLRFCPFCPTIIEDEIHFLVQCPNYKDMREMREWGVSSLNEINLVTFRKQK